MRPNSGGTHPFIAGLACLAFLLFAGPGEAARAPAGPELLREMNRPFTGDIDEIIKRRALRVLVTYSKTNYYIDGAAQRGLTCEVFQAYEKWLNKKHKTGRLPIQVIFIPVRRDQLFQALTSGKGDVAAAGLTVTEGRQEQADFTDPLKENVREVVVAGTESPHLKRIEDLAGQTVYVRRSSSYYESLHALNLRFAAQGLPPMTVQEADENLESEDIMEMVGAGLIPFTVVDRYRAELWAKVLPGVKVRKDLEVAAGGRLAWAVRKGNAGLKASLNAFLAKYRRSEEYRYLGHKYFGKAGYLKNATASEEMRRFSSAVDFFKEYAGRYGLDYLLVAAQAYQESRIDQNARSPMGALGVMQLLPSTAAAPPVSLPGIEDMETNIHAGVRYHRHIMDTWFSDPGITPVNRMLLSFAAYNAGPGNVSRMRDLTRDMGLDPDAWFGNVELAAGRLVGQETVRYVGNIYKYYVAYHLAAARAEERERTMRLLEKHPPFGR